MVIIMSDNKLKLIYEAQGIVDCKISTHDELESTQGIIVSDIVGYNHLDKFSKKVFDQFIINFINAQGLEVRETIKLLWIGNVEHITLTVEDIFDGESTWCQVGYNVYHLLEKKILHDSSISENYIEGREIEYSEPNFYLRFEYEKYGKKTWLHVENSSEWY